MTEPREEVKGDAARIWLYMSDTYAIKLTAAQKEMLKQWSRKIRPTHGNACGTSVLMPPRK